LLLVWLALKGLFFRDLLSIDLIAFLLFWWAFICFYSFPGYAQRRGVPQVGCPDVKHAFCGA
jgi:hypothetical protein